MRSVYGETTRQQIIALRPYGPVLWVIFFCFFFVVFDNDKIADYCPATTTTFALGEWLREHAH